MSVEINREWSMPSKKTFTIQPIRKLVTSEVQASDGLWIDPFCGETNIKGVDTTNDLSADIDSDYTERAIDFLSRFEDSEVDGGILLDPPYSPRQIKECYDSVGLEVSQEDTQSSWWTEIKDEVRRCVCADATVVTCGWQSDGVGLDTREILLVSHGGWHNDTIVVVEDCNQQIIPAFQDIVGETA